MNFLAHIHLARTLEQGDPEVPLGAALPDLAAMSGLTFDRDLLSPGLRRGVALHHRPDRTFHANTHFRVGSAERRRRLRAQGMATGPNRAVGHAGWELLLDGCLVERPQTADGILEALSVRVDLAPAVGDPSEVRRWTALIESLVTERWWMGYRSPLFVAQRLYGRLRHRPRLAFDAERVPDVARSLEEVRPEVNRVTDEVLASTIASLRDAELAAGR